MLDHRAPGCTGSTSKWARNKAQTSSADVEVVPDLPDLLHVVISAMCAENGDGLAIVLQSAVRS